MSDNELDNLFKEAAEGFKVPNDPSAWQDMSRKLDQAAVATSFWNWKTISSLALVGVTALSVIWYLSTDSDIDNAATSDVANVIGKESAENKTGIDIEANASSQELNSNDNKANITNNKQANASSQELKSDNKKINGVSQEPQRNNKDANSVSQDLKSKNGLIAQQSDANRSEPGSIESKGKSKHTLSEKNSNQVESLEVQSRTSQQNAIPSIAIVEQNQKETTKSTKSKEELSRDEGTRSENKAAATALIAEGVASEKLVEPKSVAGPMPSETNSNQAALSAKGSRAQIESNPVAADSLKKIEEEKEIKPVELISESEKKAEKEETKSGSRGFAIKLVVAPDYTTVESATPNSLGINYGVLFEYKFSKHWSVATGGIWSKKIYSAYDVEYSGYEADWVDGDCRMWDIPINVYYNFSSTKPFSFYASIGLSSYLMNEENYIYYVETAYGVYDYPKQVKGENNEWFKTLNVSAGMQFRMSQQFSLQFEPTLKAPLAGVGEGEVSLVSLGAFLNLRYNFPINKPGRNED